MARGKAPTQVQFEDARLLGDRLVEGSLYRLLAEQGHRMFGDEYFADCFTRLTPRPPHDPRAHDGDGDAVAELRRTQRRRGV